MSTKLSQLRVLNGDFARSYKYKFLLTATGATLKALSSYTALKTTPEKLSVSCLNVIMPSVGVQEITVEVGLHQMRLNGRHETGGTISPEFIQSGNYDVYKFFRAWANLGASHNDDIQSKNNDILATIKITALDVQNVAQKTVQLTNAWCRSCPEITFSDESNDIIRFAPEIVFEFAEDIEPAV